MLLTPCNFIILTININSFLLSYQPVPVHTTPASCRYVLLLQLHPLSPSTSASPNLSQTIFHQTFTSFRIPQLSASLFTYSPDCKVSSISQDVKGIQLIKYYSKAVSYAIMACLVTVVQIYLVRRQIKYNTSALVSCMP